MAVAEHKTPDLSQIYRYAMAAMPSIWNFRVYRLRSGARNFDLSPYVESVEWGDEGNYGEATVGMVKPDPNQNWQPLTRGDLVRLDVEYRGRWQPMWTMRVDDFPTSDTGEGTASVSVTDDLALLTRQQRDWRYRKTKARGRGWYPGEIARDVAKREGLRVGKIWRGHHRIDKLEKKDSFGLDVIFDAYNKERAKTGKRYSVRIHNGKLEISPWRRNVYLYVVEDNIESSQVTRAGKKRPITVLTGKGRVGKGKGAKKVKYRYRRSDIVRRLGMVEKEKDYGRVDSEADLRKQVKADYADEIKVKKSGSLTVTGMPFLRGAWGSLRKGEGIRVLLPAEGMTGKASWFWTKAVRHTLDGSSYTCSIDYDTEDPWLAYQEEQDKAARERKRSKRKGKKKEKKA